MGRVAVRPLTPSRGRAPICPIVRVRAGACATIFPRGAGRTPRPGRFDTDPHPPEASTSDARRRARVGAVLLLVFLGVAALWSGRAGGQPPSTGTGFLVRHDGWILTVAEVVVGARHLAVTCPGRPTVAGLVDHVVPRLDLAVIRVPLEGVPFLSLNLSITVGEVVRVGATVDTVAFITTDGRKPEAVVGEATVTGLTGPGDAFEFFQVAIPKERRGAGAPLVSVRGDVIGLLTMIDATRVPVIVVAPDDGPTWAIKAQAARPLFIAPPPQPTAKSREEAIERARGATCLIEVTR
ncbi:MAG TPA: serine protease [Pseudomonadales bacterium]|nr:serine protease [Pseudomonadales bacterium]